MDLDNYRVGCYGGNGFTLLSGRIYPRGVFNWQFSPPVQSTQLIHRFLDDTFGKKKKKRKRKISLKAFCYTSCINTIFTSTGGWNQMRVLSVGVNCTKIQERRRDHRERMWSTLRQLLRVSEQRTKKGEEKNWWSAFQHSAFLYPGLELSFPLPPQRKRTEAGFWCAFRFSHCLHVRTELLGENIGNHLV